MIAVSIERSYHSIKELINHWCHIWSWSFQAEPAQPFASTASAHPSLPVTVNWTQAAILLTTWSPILHPKYSHFPAKQGSVHIITSYCVFISAVNEKLFSGHFQGHFLSKQSICSWPQAYFKNPAVNLKLFILEIVRLSSSTASYLLILENICTKYSV